MKNILLFLLTAVVLSHSTFAQKVNEEKVTVNKTEASGFVATSKYSKEQVEEVLTAEVDKAGLKRRGKNKNFYSIRGADWPAISSTKIDVYYKVKKKKGHSKIYFVASKGYDNYVTSATDATIAANINTFLSGIDAIIEHNQEVMKKEAELKAADQNAQQAEAEKKKKEKELDELKKDN